MLNFLNKLLMNNNFELQCNVDDCNICVYAIYAGKSSTAVGLSRCYQAALLTIDGVVQEAISSGRSLAARRAKELCGEAARRHKEEQQRGVDGGGEGEEDKKVSGVGAGGGGGSLSFEAVTAHTQGTGAAGEAK